ncbi:LacI family transcriptional regulator [Microbacterium sp. AG790]|uniref:LacI family DNA-binding transcriptional regulator n=1 Tax=Microbacterium sp. AG790 TaxID=2183995 RepID=UPI000F2A4F6F|nr:LacI family DNA-binding transcriptional regulator [Microbacterium sp. AG790]RKS89299.1 LacI family transcriptional regulator [Microbacterium sp. AG790]
MTGNDNRGKPVGIEDVARAAQVSATTVSHALSGRGQVATATRERVRRVADELGYAPNRLASALRSRRSNILGFVSDDIATTPYATRVVLGAQSVARERGQLLVVVNSNHDADAEADQLAGLLSAQVDAILYARMFHQEPVQLPDQLYSIPSVLIDITDAQGRVGSVVPDEVGIGASATRTLLDAGHRDIAHATVSRPGPGANGRIEGYERAMREAGLQPRVVMGGDPPDAHAGRVALSRLLASDAPRPTAVFCFNDAMAMGAYQQAGAAGLSVPDDLSVIGVDDFEPIAAGLMPGLTTIALPHFEMGAWAVSTLLDALDGDLAAAPPIAVLPGRLKSRGSVRPPAALA